MIIIVIAHDTRHNFLGEFLLVSWVVLLHSTRYLFENLPRMSNSSIESVSFHQILVKFARPRHAASVFLSRYKVLQSTVHVQCVGVYLFSVSEQKM